MRNNLFFKEKIYSSISLKDRERQGKCYQIKGSERDRTTKFYTHTVHRRKKMLQGILLRTLAN